MNVAASAGTPKMAERDVAAIINRSVVGLAMSTFQNELPLRFEEMMMRRKSLSFMIFPLNRFIFMAFYIAMQSSIANLHFMVERIQIFGTT